MISLFVALSFVVSVSQPVELRMRSVPKRIDQFQFIKQGNFFSDPVKQTVDVEAPKAPAYIDPLMLDIGEQLALLKLRRTAGAAAVYNRLTENGAAHPDIRFFRMLVGKGLAEANSTNRYHTITVAGHMATEPLILHYCNALNIHVPSTRAASGSALQCSCGWKSDRYLRTSRALNRDIAFERHVRTAEQIHALKVAMKPPGIPT